MAEPVAAERFAALELFSDLPAGHVARVSALSHHLRAPRGTVLVEEDDISTKFFVILEGTVTVHRKGHHLADLGPGDFFGEAGTLTLAHRNASVIATTPVEAAVIMGWSLREVLDDMPQLKAKLEAASLDRPLDA